MPEFFKDWVNCEGTRVYVEEKSNPPHKRLEILFLVIGNFFKNLGQQLDSLAVGVSTYTN